MAATITAQNDIPAYQFILISTMAKDNAQWHGGKGSNQRKTDQKKFNDNWERIFGNKDKEIDTKLTQITTKLA